MQIPRLFLLFLLLTQGSTVLLAQNDPTADRARFEEIIAKAMQEFDKSNFEEALRLAVEARKIRPNEPISFIVLGRANIRLKRYEEASRDLAQAIRIAPDEPAVYFYKGVADRLRGATNDALAAYKKLLELRPDSIDGLMGIGETLFDVPDRRVESLDAFRRAAELNPKAVGPIIAGKAWRTYGAKDTQGAESLFRIALETDPEKTLVRNDLGRLLVEQGRLTEARELWNARTTDKDTTFPNFITVLERAERLRDAASALVKNPDDPNTLVSMGIATMDGDHWVVDGRQDKAIVFFRKALTIKPGLVEAQFQICRAYVQIADTFTKANADLDRELAILRKMDAKRAVEIDEYRKTYKGGLQTVEPKPKPKP